MPDKSILYPMFVLVVWTLLIVVVMVRRAYRAVGEGLNLEYFRHGRGYEPPGYMLSAYRHFSNLFEMPVLFYVAIITIYVTALNSMLLLALAWAYVLVRMLHSRYHLRNSNIIHRRNAFLTSYMVLTVMWLVVAYRLITA